ncbi:MAG: LysR family transcriptional regulator [Eubacteriales bacterium]|nr:LysR family transcriptional regulator [Eubacteriales bacterium]
MEINHIRYVIEVAKQKSFTKAANNLFITQPAISHQINALEKELKVELFNRNTHGVKLTRDGEKFCKYGESVLKAMEELEYIFGISENNISKIKVGLYMFFRVSNFNNAIIDFISKHHIDVKVSAIETTEAYELLKNDNLDFAIVKNWEKLIPEDIEYHTLSTEPLMILMSRDNDCSSNAYISLEELESLKLLIDRREPALYDNFISLCTQNNVKLNASRLDTDGPDMEIAAVQANLGVSLVTKTTGEYYTNDKLVAIPIHPEINLIIALLHRKKKKLPPVFNAFINHIIENIK